jgi:hypothetical protein
LNKSLIYSIAIVAFMFSIEMLSAQAKDTDSIHVTRGLVQGNNTLFTFDNEMERKE